MEKKNPTRQNAFSAFEELEGWIDQAEDDPTGAGVRLREQIIHRATAFVSGKYDFVNDSGNDRHGQQDHAAALADKKGQAEEIRTRAMALPIGGP